MVWCDLSGSFTVGLNASHGGHPGKGTARLRADGSLALEGTCMSETLTPQYDPSRTDAAVVADGAED